jgi:predicted phage terminase large subunit-like protein
LINVPPGMMKSMLVSVLWPAWELGPKNMPYLRYVCASHSQELAVRDNVKARRLVESEWYRSMWGDRVVMTGDQNVKTKWETTAGGFRQAVATSSMTGARGDRVLIDDPMSVDGASSDAERQSTINWFLEAVPTRLNSPEKSAIIVIMQRLHEEDVSGVIHNMDLGYTSVILPMEYDTGRRCETNVMWQPLWSDGPEPFSDPREVDGELLFPERFSREVVERDKVPMGSYAVAGQFQQLPVPRGGGILKYDYWQEWDEQTALANNCEPGKFPDFEFVLASVDTAYTEKQENDPSALTVWGLWTDKQRRKRVMLMYGWAKHLVLHGPAVPRLPNEDKDDYRIRSQKSWGLIEWIADSCKRYRVDKLLIESKASGISVAQEIRRLYARDNWSVQLMNPGSQDKVTRAHQVQPMFEGGMIYAPVPVDGRSVFKWAEDVKNECATFPKGRHDDRVDSVTMALSWLRNTGMLQMDTEARYDIDQSVTHRGAPLPPIYPV